MGVLSLTFVRKIDFKKGKRKEAKFMFPGGVGGGGTGLGKIRTNQGRGGG